MNDELFAEIQKQLARANALSSVATGIMVVLMRTIIATSPEDKRPEVARMLAESIKGFFDGRSLPDAPTISDVEFQKAHDDAVLRVLRQLQTLG